MPPLQPMQLTELTWKLCSVRAQMGVATEERRGIHRPGIHDVGHPEAIASWRSICLSSMEVNL